jgi:malate dehydrogenase (oxaloacetate-decarboxylating)
LGEVIRDADVFIGVSGRSGLLSKDMVQHSMATNAIVFALSNPDPEILPSEALEAGARIVVLDAPISQTRLTMLLYFRQF